MGSQRLNGLQVHLEKLAKLADGAQRIPAVLAEVAQLGVGEIQKIITNEIEPHKRGDQVVTDLVDTGHYRQSWTAQAVNESTWLISTNVPYARLLEYGFNGTVAVPEHSRTRAGKTFRVKAHRRTMNRRPYYVARRGKIRIRNLLREAVRREIGKLAK